MITPGMCSLTLRQLPPESIIRLVSGTRLQAIEWWGKDHVPPGSLAAAKTIGRLTKEAGLCVCSYGSYYKTSIRRPEGTPFLQILDTAAALGARSIRVWAGDQNLEKTTPDHLEGIAEDTLRIADLAAQTGCSLTFEFHSNSLTNTPENARFFADKVRHPNVHFSWQPPHGFSRAHNLAGLRTLLDRLSTLHVYHWTIGSRGKNLFNESQRTPVWPGDFHRHPLLDGTEDWRAYLDIARTSGRHHFALLEFVRDDSVEQFLADATTLTALCQHSESLQPLRD
jgi:3-dehydroshikimate dehydratase